jgi:hypothetical protein
LKAKNAINLSETLFKMMPKYLNIANANKVCMEKHNHLFEELSNGLSEMEAKMSSLDKLVNDCSAEAAENALQLFENEGYFVASFNPPYVLGKRIRIKDLAIRPVIFGVKGYAKKEIGLEYIYIPKGYKPYDLLAPPEMKEDNCYIMSAKDIYNDHFSKQLKLNVSFKENYFVLTRNVPFDSESLPLELERFKKDLALARLNLDRDGKKKVSGSALVT